MRIRLGTMLGIAASVIMAVSIPLAATAATAHQAAPTAAVAAAQPHSAAHAAGPQITGGCKSYSSYCDYAFTNPNFSTNGNVCFIIDANLANWDDNPQVNSCRNVDEAFDNNTPDVVRLYYSPNYSGAWVCIPAHTGIENLSGKPFNNGSGLAGYGQSIFNNVASSTISTGTCSNPTT
jgi:hypothetical protein